MLAIDIPNLPDMYIPALIAEYRQITTAPTVRTFTLGVCHPVPNVDFTDHYNSSALDPIATLSNYLWNVKEYRKIPEEPRRQVLQSLRESATFTVLAGPSVGSVIRDKGSGSGGRDDYLTYTPVKGDMRKDRVVVLVEMGGYKVKLIYNVYPVPDASVIELAPAEAYCGKRGLIYEIRDTPGKPRPLKKHILSD